jgi:hypothetical protein
MRTSARHAQTDNPHADNCFSRFSMRRRKKSPVQKREDKPEDYSRRNAGHGPLEYQPDHRLERHVDVRYDDAAGDRGDCGQRAAAVAEPSACRINKTALGTFHNSSDLLFSFSGCSHIGVYRRLGSRTLRCLRSFLTVGLSAEPARSHAGGRDLRTALAGVADFLRNLGAAVETRHSGRRAAGADALAFMADSARN